MTDRTPILVGAGQCVVRDEFQEGQAADIPSPADLAGRAARQALDDALSCEALAPHIDCIATTRLTDDSASFMKRPFGGPDNVPRAVGKRIGADPSRAIYSVPGGQSPQRLISELAQAIRAGDHELCLVAGAEATRATRQALRLGLEVDWNEEVGGSLEDRGYGDHMMTKEEMRHGAFMPPFAYSFLEHALRASLGRTREEHVSAMARLFSALSQVAARHPIAQFPEARSVEFLSTPSQENYPLTDPYLKWFVAQDAVNQGAAVVLTSVAWAREKGIPAEKWIYLHGIGDADDGPWSERADLSRSFPLKLAAKRALEMAGVDSDAVGHFDLYSCFPCAVFAACEALGLNAGDERGLTVTGGLPFFGGAGNNYSLHAIATMMERLRQDRASYGLVSANGGFLSKQSVAVYSARVPEGAWLEAAGGDLQEDVKAAGRVAVAVQPQGAGEIESYTIVYHKGRPARGIVLGRLAASDQRFLAVTAPEDRETVQAMVAQDPLRRPVTVTPGEKENRFVLS